MYKIGVIGDRESALGFRALGIDVFPCEDGPAAKKTLRKMAKNDYAIIYITEKLAAEITEEIDKYNDMMLPAIIPIPGRDGVCGAGMENVRKSVERAVGADILFGGEK